jgi:hypothetical protein
MVAQVRLADGTPVVGLTVESVEAKALTGPDGSFAVTYKEPNLHAHFRFEGAFYKRAYRRDDHGSVIQLLLPELEDLTLGCPEVVCSADLSWELAPGFDARTTVACRPGIERALGKVPKLPATLACRASRAGPPLDLQMKRDGAVLQLSRQPRPIRVTVDADGDPPEACSVMVGEGRAVPEEGGVYLGRASEAVQVSATCDGRAARPRLGDPDKGSVALLWSSSGPVVDVTRQMPWAKRLKIDAKELSGEAWRLEIEAGEDGTWSLPPLLAGTYQLHVSGEAKGPDGPPPDAPVDGELAFGDAVEDRKEGPRLGVLRLTADKLDGVLTLK